MSAPALTEPAVTEPAVTGDDLRARLAQAGIALREGELPSVLATARFLARAADLVRQAQTR